MTPLQPTAASRRLFIALWPDAATRNALQARQGGWTWTPAARPTRADDLHLTLHFIGAVGADQVAALAGRLESVLRPQRFQLCLDGFDLWPNGVAVLLPSRLPIALTEVHARLGQVLLSHGLAPDPRPFRPHVTLARRATGSLAATDPAPLDWTVQGFVLAESKGGYRVLQTFD
jgi:2'-5' RNA ligase